MKRWIFLLIVALIFFANRKENIQSEQVQTPQKLDGKVKPVGDYLPKKYPPVLPKKRTPAAKQALTKRKIDRKLSSLRKESPMKIGTSFEVVEDLSAIKKADYRPGMGKKNSENKHLVFFHPASQVPEALPVAMHVSSQRLYPISHVLHVKGVDSRQRDILKSEGMNEFYYHPRMKLLSLETSPSTVLAQYQSLLKRGFDVRLEVLKDPPSSK